MLFGMRTVGKATSVGAGRGLVVFGVLAAVLGAAAIALTPFRDHGHTCAPPIVSAVHGRPVRAFPGSPAFLPPEVREQLRAVDVIVCRDPARDRLAIAGGVAVVLFAVAMRWRVLDPRRRYPVYRVDASLR